MKRSDQERNYPQRPKSRTHGLSQGGAAASPHERCTPTEQVVLDLDLPHLAIEQALQRSDDAAIWREYARTRDEERFVHFLGQLAASHRTKQQHFRYDERTTEWHHTLVAVPFLLPAPGGQAPLPSQDDRGGAAELAGELQRWAGHKQEAKVMLGSVKYADLCRWSPVTQRHYLQQLAGERPGDYAHRESMQLKVPSATAQLAFVFGSVRCWNTAPQLYELAPQPAWELRSRMAAYLAYANQVQVTAQQVLLPAPVQEAVLAGLLLWLGELARSANVREWQLQPTGKDAVVLRLALEGEGAAQAVIPIRLHQIGADGLDVVLADLHERVGPPSEYKFND